MKNFLKNKRIIVPAIIISSIFTVAAFAADPGSSSDPLISLSYFEDKIESLKTSLLTELTSTFSSKFAELEKNVDKTLEDLSKNGVTSGNEFKVINIAEGETIVCESGTEIIVRSGKSIVVTDVNSSGGISDITAGKDLKNGEEIINNHLLIVPKTDGRGIKSTVSGAIMIKGKYTSK